MSLIGNVGGTLGMFVGFSILGATDWVLEWFQKHTSRLLKWKELCKKKIQESSGPEDENVGLSYTIATKSLLSDWLQCSESQSERSILWLSCRHIMWVLILKLSKSFYSESDLLFYAHKSWL